VTKYSFLIVTFLFCTLATILPQLFFKKITWAEAAMVLVFFFGFCSFLVTKKVGLLWGLGLRFFCFQFGHVEIW